MANFAKKLDLDNHVLNYRARLKSDYDRKLRAKNFAKLYYLNKEYSKALRYLTEFMSVKNDCPAAYKLQGRIQEALLERENAIQSYMKSLELDQSQSDLFEKIMELIPHTNLEPDKVKLWTERLQLARKDSDLLEKIKICSPCSPPGNITLDILNNSINDPVTPISVKNPDLNLTDRSDDIHSTPKSGRFASPKALSPYATKVNFEKIEKELIILSQAQEGICSKVGKLQTDVTKSSSEIIDAIKSLQKSLEKFNLAAFSGELEKNLTDIKVTVNKHTDMMDKVMKSQVNLEDAIYEFTESYGDTQGDGGATQNDENKPVSEYSEYTSDSYPTAHNPYISGPPDQTFAVDSVFNPKSTGVFSRLGQSPGSGFMFQPAPNPSMPGPSYVPISPPAVEQSLPPRSLESQFFKLPINMLLVKPVFQQQSHHLELYPWLQLQVSLELPVTTQTSFPTSVAADSMKKTAPNEPTKPLSELWKPKGWECNACYTRNDANSKQCAACETLAPGASPVSKPTGTFNFGIPMGIGTKVDETPNFSFSLPVKSQFDLAIDSSSKDLPRNVSNISAADTSFSSSNTSSNKSSDFSFKLEPSSNTTSGPPSFPLFTSGSPFNTSSFGNTNKSPTSQPSIFGNTKSESNKEGQSGISFFGNMNSTSPFTFNNSGLQTDVGKAPVKETFMGDFNRKDTDLEIVYVKEPKSQQAVELAKKYKLPLNFYDYENVKPCPGCRGCDEDTPKEKPADPKTSQPFESSADSGSNLFAAAIATYGAPQTNWETGKSNWSAITTPAPVFQRTSKGGDEEENFATGEDAGGSENAVFKLPTIQMPDIIEVKTGEEDEQPQFTSRAKIFLFSDKDKEWKERGVGDFKILKNPTNNSYRMLLRRDKVLKIACNQRISSGIKFETMENSENALTWAGVDYSEEPEKPGKFCIKFKNKDIANEFHSKVEDIKSKLSTN
ncbi:LOW QUALITY PROTEIN: uncharacterized protein LOC128386481 [Panonychus citri]|uniref:LOW QUALITY PROTEIN: uncharacterized protein LOC128386481 n=1 Tax=Panonychus citri TaxID=50023 RepID=UPI002307BDFD|nr:LOW QUALITY PROTEIN: uncharacterized protein LOC128386481 [Panonychus citri]